MNARTGVTFSGRQACWMLYKQEGDISLTEHTPSFFVRSLPFLPLMETMALLARLPT